jgi:hypothetical protein
MDAFIHWAGFAGAWLLVAGPLFQAAVELRDEAFDGDQFDPANLDVAEPPRISSWWWLLPPVAYWKNKKRSDAQHKAVLAALNIEQREQFVGFMNKATGWFTVAAGAFLIALKETWELNELYELPVAVYWIVVVVLSVLAVGNTVFRLVRADSMIHVDDPEYAERRRTERAQAIEKRRAQAGKPARPQRTPKKPPAGAA